MTDKTTHPPLAPAFAQLGVRNSLLRALAEMKFQTPSEIQSLLIPRAMAGVDILGQARTGTGKTAAFGVPVLCKAQPGIATQALILVPTRELAVQMEIELKRLGQFTPLRTVAVYGGQRITAQMKFLRQNPEILVGTPGRVIDLLDRKIISLNNARFIVLDEVDRMLDIGFRKDIRNILSRVTSVRRKLQAREDENEQLEASESPADRHDIDQAAPADDSGSAAPVQLIFVSATFSPEIEGLARRYMSEPIEKLIARGADEKPTVEKVEQRYFAVQPWDKYVLLRLLLQREQPDLAIVFCRTKRGAEKLAKRLTHDGIECREIHGNLAQNKRDRVMKSFRTGKFDVLIATDLASRGIDVADITHIINYDIPQDPEVYVHRVGRTARMGAQGKAFTFVSRDQGGELTKIERLINIMIPQATLEGFEPSPTPHDWKENKPVAGESPAKAAAPAAGPSAKRGLGSKIPVTRRHRRRR